MAAVALLAAVLLVARPAAAQLWGAKPAADKLDDSHLLPWEYPKGDGGFRWEGLHNNLKELLKAQAQRNAVAVVVFNKGFAPIALNCIVSLVRYGKAHNYIVAAVGDSSVEHCLELRLPCYNASEVVPKARASEGDAGRNTQEWFNMVWAKTLVTNAIFNERYDVLFLDADIVFLKEAFPNYNRFLDEYNADGTFMTEARIKNATDGTEVVDKYLNSGNFFLRNNYRTREMMTEWMVGYFHQADRNGNQLWLNWMKAHPGPPYGICNTRAECTKLKDQGVAAIKPHPGQFDGRAQMCLPDKFDDICGDKRVYVHAVCLSGGHAKKKALERLKLWFIHIYSMPDDITVSVPKGCDLPCAKQEAWRGAYDV